MPERPTKPEFPAVRQEEAPVVVRPFGSGIRGQLDSRAPKARHPGAEPDEPPASVSRNSMPLVDGDDVEERPTAVRAWTNSSVPPAQQKVASVTTLVRIDASAGGQLFALPPYEVRIGRGKEADLRVDDEGVSRTHALLRPCREGVELLDLGSSNGTRVGGEETGRTVLRHGDVVELGPRVAFRVTVMDQRQADVMQRLFESSVRDPLTGAHNRQYLESRLQAEFAYAQRHRTDMGFLIFDIDHFKKVNDTYGHPAGDAVLKFVAGVIMSRLRTEDLFARYGGEEFVVVLRGIDLAGTARAGDRLRTVISSSCPVHEGQMIPVTVSIGAASYVSDAERTIESLIKTADQRLYIAKRSGRNRVVASDG